MNGLAANTLRGYSRELELSRLVFGKVGWFDRVVSAQSLNWSTSKYLGVRLVNWWVPAQVVGWCLEKCGAPHSTAAGSSAAAAAPPGTAWEQLCLLQNLKTLKAQSSKQLRLLQNLKTLKVRAASRLSESDQNRQISQFCEQVIASWAKVLSKCENLNSDRLIWSFLIAAFFVWID